MQSREQLLAAARACGDFFVRNQVTDRNDANRGRTIRTFYQATGACRLTENWLTGAVCMSLLALHKRTGDEDYLHAAERAGRYIMSMQNMDSRDERYYGLIPELTPQSLECCPRDGTTAAWALVWLYEATGNPVYLDRAVVFGEWHMNHAMLGGWPLWAVFRDDVNRTRYWKGSFQSGTGLFYHDLFMATDRGDFIERGMRPIAEQYRDDFVAGDGHIVQRRERFSNNVVGSGRGGVHMYNDDFGAAMLMAAADLFDDERYLDAARRFAGWLAGEQREDGGFPPEYPSGVPVAMMYFHDLGDPARDERLLQARDKALTRLLAMQVKDTGEPRMDGAFQGAYEGPKGGEGANGLCVNTRTSSYALVGLLKLESDLPDIWLGRCNCRFTDPLAAGEKPDLVW